MPQEKTEVLNVIQAGDLSLFPSPWVRPLPDQQTLPRHWCYFVLLVEGKINGQGRIHPLLGSFTRKGMTDRSHRLLNQLLSASSPPPSTTLPSWALILLQLHRETVVLLQDAQGQTLCLLGYFIQAATGSTWVTQHMVHGLWMSYRRLLLLSERRMTAGKGGREDGCFSHWDRSIRMRNYWKKIYNIY